MVSDASKKKAASKKAAAAEKRGSKSAAAVAQSKLKDVQNGVSNDSAVADEMAALMITDRTCTGVLASHPQSRDIHVSFVFDPCCLIWIFVLGSAVRRSHASPPTC
jgi:ATP-binding cassette subfamily F protein 2